MHIFQLKNVQFMYGLYTTELSVVSQMIGKVEGEHPTTKVPALWYKRPSTFLALDARV